MRRWQKNAGLMTNTEGTSGKSGGKRRMRSTLDHSRSNPGSRHHALLQHLSYPEIMGQAVTRPDRAS